jgi:hypothetical protein
MGERGPDSQYELVELFLAGATAGVRGAMSIEGDRIMSFGWYPIAQRVGPGIWLRRQMYSVATARQIKTIRRALVSAGFVETEKITDSDKVHWWSWQHRER